MFQQFVYLDIYHIIKSKSKKRCMSTFIATDTINVGYPLDELFLCHSMPGVEGYDWFWGLDDIIVSLWWYPYSLDYFFLCWRPLKFKWQL